MSRSISAPSSPSRSALRTFVIIFGLFLLYAFAVHYTEVSPNKLLDERRQELFINVVRKLANPLLLQTNSDTGALQISERVRTTTFLMVQTVLMALMATTVGTILAVPISFLAARNLMSDVKAPLASILLALLGMLAGGAVGWLLAGAMFDLSGQASAALSPLLALIAASGTLALGWLLLAAKPVNDIFQRTAVTFKDALAAFGPAAFWTIQIIRVALVLLLVVFSLGILADLGSLAGDWLADRLGIFSFLGNFIIVLADLITLVLPAFVALVIGVIGLAAGSRIGQEAALQLTGTFARLVTGAVAALGVFTIVVVGGTLLNGLYQFDNIADYTTSPGLVLGAAASILGVLISPKRPFPIGMFIYTVSRAILNALRSIEPIIMAIVFVVWVSLGPFAGVMALTLHSIAALGKLFSEQVEGIAEGPIEAITATGANRLQTIVYAVIPQIVPLYIAYTLYRWDINVRTSTIIGFVGGGGIGRDISDAIRLSLYRDASVMMLAIAIVVSALDYFSSIIRKRII